MTVHHMKRHVVPDMQAIHDQLDIMLRDLETMMDTLQMCHHVNKYRLTQAVCLRDGMKRELMIALRGSE